MLEPIDINEWIDICSNSRRMFVEFMQPNCAPCKKMHPILQTLEVQYPELLFVKVDVTLIPELIEIYEILSTPTIAILDNEEIVERMIGIKNRREVMQLLTNN